jgi:hypothetical protein
MASISTVIAASFYLILMLTLKPKASADFSAVPFICNYNK